MSTFCVIGAGVSGLTTARELERAGHDVIVLDSADTIAGKCGSVDVDGFAYDLGGHVCTTAYVNLAELVTELGLETEPTTPHRVYDTETGESGPQSSAFFRKDAFSRYAELRASRFPQIGTPGLAHSAKALAQPVSSWLAENDLGDLAESLGTGYTAAGYGYLGEDIPALYFVKYAEMTGLLSNKPDLLGHAGSFTIKGGFGELWQRVAAELKDVRLGVRVQSIQRTGGCVRIRFDDKVIQVDGLVLTVPIDQVPALDATEEELELAAEVRYLDYYTTFATAGGLPRSAFSLVRQQCEAEDGRLVSFHHRYPETDVFACYSYGSDEVAEDIAAMGGQVEQVHLSRQWKFMPHFSSEALAAGVLDRVEALQGKRRTYHVGSLPAFELVECNVAYVRALVDRFFTADDAPAVEVGARQTSTATSGTGVSVGAQEIRDWLVRHVAEAMRVPEDAVGPDVPLVSLGLESLAVAGLLSGLSEWLGFRVPHTLFLELPTVDAIAAHLAAQQESPVSRQVVEAQQPALTLALTPPRPFFCIGGAVGAAYYLLPLARAIGQAQPFYGLQGPGFDGTEEPVDDVEALAERYIDEIKLTQPYGPYVIGGHSFGGVVAYEVGRKLRARGEQVDRVVMIDAYPAVPGQSEPPWDEAAVIDELWTIRQYAFRDKGAPRRRLDQTLSPQEQREQLGRFLGASGTRPVEEHIGNIMRVYQAQVEAIVRYQPPSSDLKVTLIKAGGGFPQVLKDERHIELFLDDPANGWERVTTGELEVITVPGDHFNALVPPCLTTLADAVRSTLRKIPAPPPPKVLNVESAIHINPMNPDFLADPYPFYDLLRDLAPVYYDEALDGWVLTRHAEVTEVLRKSTVVRPSTGTLLTRLPADVRETMNPFVARLDMALPFSNRPTHTRLRQLMNRSFTPRAMASRREIVRETAEELLDAFASKGGGDFLAEFAYPFPSRVVMDLIGVPRADQPQLMRWATDVMMVLGQAQFGDDPVEVAWTSSAAMDALMDYLLELIAVRRAIPCDDLMSEHACMDTDAGDLFGSRGEWNDDEELAVNLISLINAGLETTANYLGNGLLALLRDPEQYALLREEPAVVTTAVDELLRYDSPAPIISPQLATEDFEVAGRLIKAGDLIFPVLGAANRDPAQYDDPHALDLRRASAVTHMTFGSGIHYCIGAALGRMEGEIAFGMIPSRFPNLRLDPDAPAPAYRRDPALRGLESLHVLI